MREPGPSALRLMLSLAMAKEASRERWARRSPVDKQPSVSAPDARLLAAKSERVRLPNTSPNFRARVLSVVSLRLDPQVYLQLTL
jgi:hypothetical protein